MRAAVLVCPILCVLACSGGNSGEISADARSDALPGTEDATNDSMAPEDAANWPPLVVSATELETEEAGEPVRFTVKLGFAPEYDVTVNISCSDLTEGTVSPGILSFKPYDWDVARTVVLTPQGDPWFDGTKTYQVEIGPAVSFDTGFDGEVAKIDVENADTQPLGIVSHGPNEALGNQTSTRPSISRDGSIVAFDTRATNFVPNDTNNEPDVFVWSKDTGAQLVSVSVAGVPGNAYSGSPELSADGRYVVFNSWASDLVDEDTNEASDAFVRDLELGTTTRISVSSTGDEANGGSSGAHISADGRFVVFNSSATNLVDDDDNDAPDVFLHDRDAGTTVRIAEGGTPRISASGRYVVFTSGASDLVVNDTNDATDCFLYDREAKTFERISVAGDGTQGTEASHTAHVSDDGRYVAFTSAASNLVAGDTNDEIDAFVRDRTEAKTELISVAHDGGPAIGAGGSSVSHMSPDGRFVAIQSNASNLVENDTNGVLDGFLRDRQTKTTYWVSQPLGGGTPDHLSGHPIVDEDASHVAFISDATNLLPGDENGHRDVFLLDRR